MVTPVFRVNYPNVFKTKLNKLSNKEEYSVVALFKKGENLDGLKAAAKAAMEKKFGLDPAKWPANWRSPFRDQAECVRKDKTGNVIQPPTLPEGYEAGAIYLNLKSSQKPGVVDQNVQAIMDETKIYSGCYAKASVNASAYGQMGNFGVSFYLTHLQLVRDGESLGGRTRPEDDFQPIAVEGGAVAAGSSAASLF